MKYIFYEFYEKNIKSVYVNDLFNILNFVRS